VAPLLVAVERVKYFLQESHKNLQKEIVDAELKQEKNLKDMELNPEDDQFWGKALLSITSGYIAIGIGRELRYSKEKDERVQKCQFEISLHEKNSLWTDTNNMIDELLKMLTAKFSPEETTN
jgi:hypothetical protein